MTAPPLQCPKCDAAMERGFMVDHTSGATLVSQWMPGEPQSSLWRGTKIDAEKFLPIGAFRCTECGYLEYYARPEFGAK